MATQTTNFNLTKPEVNDYVDVSVLANNFDLIDTAIFEAGNNPELEGNVAGLVEKIGNTTDVGGSNTTGSVMGKLNTVINQNTREVSLTGEGATVYESNEPVENIVWSKVRCVGKFIAPVSGLYKININAKNNDTSVSDLTINKLEDGRTSSGTYYISTDLSYALCSVGDSPIAAVGAGGSFVAIPLLSLSDTPSKEVIRLLKPILNIPKIALDEIVTKEETFYCKAGEKVILAIYTSQSKMTLNTINITYQPREAI